jgi:plastocyanin
MSRCRRSMVIGVGVGAVAVGIGAGAALVPSIGLANAKPKVVKLIKVEDDFYSPKKLTIKRGTELNFVWNKNNLDTHNVKLKSGPKGAAGFKSRAATSGVKFNHIFTQPGTYHLFCTLHPTGMKMTVIVKK